MACLKRLTGRYRDGMLQAKSNEPDTVALIDGATKGMVATAEMHGPNAIEEWEVMTSSAAVFEADWQVDELLRWTTSLNYDEYWSSWKVQATSAVSEDLVGKAEVQSVNNTQGFMPPYFSQLSLIL